MGQNTGLWVKTRACGSEHGLETIKSSSEPSVSDLKDVLSFLSASQIQEETDLELRL